MNPSFKTVALIGKYQSPEIAEPLLRLGRFLESRKIEVLLDRLTAGNIQKSAYPVLNLDEIGNRADLAIVMGGDGTMLNIARTLVPYKVPLVGINHGRLGFLTDISIDTMQETIGAMLDGEFITEERILLNAEVVSNGSSIFSALAFNDVVVHRGVKGRMIEFEVTIDGQFVYTQRSDGLIVATPNGSTAYALSSGGPILHPGLRLFALVPICSHTFSNRPIVVSSESTVEILMHHASDARAHFDSHSFFDLKENDKVVVRRHSNSIRLLHPVGHNYYHMLREKLHWSVAPSL